MIDQKKLWDDAMVEVELNISKANFITWFKNTYIYKIDDNVIYLSVPNAFVKDWLSNKYHKFILKAIRNIIAAVRNIEYVIQKDGSGPRKIQPNKIMSKPEMAANGNLGLDNLYINKEDNLNPKYTFEAFIVGPFNALAHAAAQGIIKKPGTSYNPLLVYGGTGLGKTHLIQAIGNDFKTQGKKVYYISSERFVTEIVETIKNNTIHNYKEKYRKYDLLIMDDVQFIAGKDKCQEELFHIFNGLYDNNKQIIFSSDKPPSYMANLEERLRSRFEGGMIVDISKPELESRMAILNEKAKFLNFNLSKESTEFIASSVKDNIRELEGVLNAIVCQSQLKNRELSLPEIKSLIKNNIAPQKTVSIKDVIKVVSDFYNIEERNMYEKTRRKEVVKPRQIAMYILREDFNTSYPYIGQKLGGRDHTTVIHACEKIKNDMKKSDSLGQEIEQIKNIIYSSSNSLNSVEN